MLKLLSVFLFVIMFTTATMHAQILPEPPQSKESRTNLKQVFSKETDKIKSESSVIDAKSMEKAQRQKTTRSKWTGKQTALIVLFAVGVAALVFVLIKYGKNCLRYENNCNPSDDGCYCAEYEQQNQARRFSLP